MVKSSKGWSVRAMLPTRNRTTRAGRKATAATYAAAALAVVSACAAPAPSRAADLVVAYDQSQLLRLPRPVSSIIIGNPSIADVSVEAGNLLVVTGKTFGITNVIALDAERNIIQDQRVVVTRDETRTVSLTKGGKRESYACTPNCSPMITAGDDEEYFKMISSHAVTKSKIAEGAGAGNAPEAQ